MKKSIIIHILKECNLSCDLCYACSPKRLNPIKKDELNYLSQKGFVITPDQLKTTISQIPKKYEINLRGGEFSLYPNWDYLSLSFAKAGHKIIIDTNGQWVPYSENKLDNNFLKILKNLKHKNITIYFSYDPWHENKDTQLKKRTKMFIKYAEKYNLNYFIFSTGLEEKKLKEYYKDFNLDFSKVRFNQFIYKLGKQKDNKNAKEYTKENEILVIDSNGDAYPCLKTFSKKNARLRLGNIKFDSFKELYDKTKKIST